MILDSNGMPILQPGVDNASTATFNTAFAAIGVAKNGRVPLVGDLDALAARSASTEGEIVHVDEGGANFQAQDGSWVQITDAVFASAATRDSAYNKGGGAYRVQGLARVYRSDVGWTEQYYAAYNATSNPGGANPAGWYPVGEAKPYGRMNKSGQGGSISSTEYTDLSGNVYWTASDRLGFTAYNAGWTVPMTGMYRISTAVQANATILTGISINNTSPPIAALRSRVSAPVLQNIAVASQSSEIELVAGQVVRLFALAITGTATWSADPLGGYFNLEFLHPRRG